MEPLYHNLLLSDEIIAYRSPDLKVQSGPMGSYNSMEFVLRLRKDIHLELNQIEPGIKGLGIITPEQSQAFSTYLHETIHWWQYVGSNFGFISSLKYPSQAHTVWPDLQGVLRTCGAFKSIEEYHDMQKTVSGKADVQINRILNYWYDLEAGGAVSFDPDTIRYFLETPFFVSIGHSSYIMYSAALNSLASTVDRDFSFIPNAGNWAKEFKKLQDEKVMWHDPEPSEIIMPRFGTRAIFEGQARVSQLQYLYFSSGGQYHFQDFQLQGMLNDIYVEALDHFLNILNEKLPATPDDPLIGLFLLLCDIAINPTDGFPFDIDHFPSFVVSTDPGFRFRILCIIIRDQCPYLKNAIVSYSKEEYVDISLILCHAMKCRSPYESAEYVSGWANNHSSIIALLEEEKQFKFEETNLPVRLFLSKYVRYNQDKYAQPQFFCWPGASLIGLPSNQVPLKEIEIIFNRHKALFVDSIDGNVYAASQEGINGEQLETTLSLFYRWNSVYSMVRQWINQTGPFNYDLRWLTKKHTPEETKDWVCDTFVNIFGHHPDSFEIL